METLLLRNVFEERNMSMKLYADRLERALRPYTQVSSVHPWQPMRRNRLPIPLRQGLDYALRYLHYPHSLRGQSADIFHIIDHSYAHLVSKLPGERTVITCHDLMLLKLAAGEFGTRKPPRTAMALFEKSVSYLSRAAAVIAVSRATASDLTKYLGIAREVITVIHHGMNGEYGPGEPQLREQLRARHGLADRAVLLHVSGNSFYKNLEGIIQALSCLNASRSGLKPVLVKVGKPLTSEQRRLAERSGVWPLIREVGVSSQRTVQELYWAADVVVFPSLWEGFGWPPLEAMASGTPVVTTHCGALREVVGEAAEIVDPHDPEDIARGVARVLQDETRRQELVTRGYSRVKLFRWEEAAQAVFSVYQSVAANPDEERAGAPRAGGVVESRMRATV